MIAKDENVEFFNGIKKVFRHKSYRTLLFVFLFVSTAVQVRIKYDKKYLFKLMLFFYKKLVQSNIALFCKYAIDAGDQYQFLIITILVKKKHF